MKTDKILSLSETKSLQSTLLSCCACACVQPHPLHLTFARAITAVGNPPTTAVLTRYIYQIIITRPTLIKHMCEVWLSITDATECSFFATFWTSWSNLTDTLINWLSQQDRIIIKVVLGSGRMRLQSVSK